MLIIVLVFMNLSKLNAQQSRIKLETSFGSENKEIQDILRFQDIETIKLKFYGAGLKNKNYRLLVKEYTNGNLAKVDTIMDTSKSEYFSSINDTIFGFRYFVKTQIDNTIKMKFLFNHFSTERNYNIRKIEDKYALHDFLDANENMSINEAKSNVILGYFLPYTDIETGWKKYCEVSASEHKPEDWGSIFNIPNYYLIDIIFE